MLSQGDRLPVSVRTSRTYGFIAKVTINKFFSLAPFEALVAVAYAKNFYRNKPKNAKDWIDNRCYDFHKPERQVIIKFSAAVTHCYHLPLTFHTTASYHRLLCICFADAYEFGTTIPIACQRPICQISGSSPNSLASAESSSDSCLVNSRSTLRQLSQSNSGNCEIAAVTIATSSVAALPSGGVVGRGP